MLTQICQYLRNWFEREKFFGAFAVSGGVLTYADGTALPLLSGQYYRIIGSVFSDGVHRWADAKDTLPDETFTGAVWSMGIPADVLTLAADVAAWCAKYAGTDSAAMSPFTSESFGGYTYSKNAGGGTGSAGGGTSWQAAFADRLAPWRKI